MTKEEADKTRKCWRGANRYQWWGRGKPAGTKEKILVLRWCAVCTKVLLKVAPLNGAVGNAISDIVLLVFFFGAL